MAHAATMGPPMSPRETRRSGRRSVPSASTSASKSPDSDPAPRQKESSSRPPPSTNSSRSKRLKQEDLEESGDDRKGVPPNTSTPSTQSSANSRTKRRAKDKDKTASNHNHSQDVTAVGDLPPDTPEEEEQGITRCVCGSSGEDDPDAGEFMVQCETCKVWQHGLCMGYEYEQQVHDQDYYCEKCRPELHVDLVKKIAKKARHSSTTSHPNTAPASSRMSRSHSPSLLSKQASKRRNTMNSRDAAFDESLKELIEATAAEAAAAHDTMSVTSLGNATGVGDNEDEQENSVSHPPANNRKKRKRTEDDPPQKKRTRSASTTSDRLVGPAVARDDIPNQPTNHKQPLAPPPPPQKSNARNKRAPRKYAVPDGGSVADGEDGAPQPSRRQSGNSRNKGASSSRRQPPTVNSPNSAANSANDPVSRRAQTNGNTASTTASDSRAYRNSHAYVVSQQPLLTSWHLPDYLAHLEEMLPTDTPKPLEVRAGQPVNTPGGQISVGRGDSAERTIERGVKVKWPSKRMSVVDMNKRVRSLVEWVGREQASALDRGRRRVALERALKEETETHNDLRSPSTHHPNLPGDTPMAVDEPPHRPTLSINGQEDDDCGSSATMKMMEELMEELIGFQERFGPGTKTRERDRRVATNAGG